MVARKPNEDDNERAAPAICALWSNRQHKEREARVSGAAALAILNDDADKWQRVTAPELQDHYLTTIDYVSANFSCWRAPATLRPKIEAAAHAYRRRSQMACATRWLVAFVGVALGVAVKAALKPGTPLDGLEMASGVIGAAVMSTMRQVVRMPFLDVHKERASRWKKLLDRLRAALAEALGEI